MAQRLLFETDELYLGLTRPPMLAGVTEVYVIFMLFVEALIFLSAGGGTGFLLAAGSSPFLYLFGRAMCANDPRIFEIWLLKLRLFTPAKRQARIWQGPSLDPF